MAAETHPIPSIAAQIGRAAALCARHGTRLTALREQVLRLVLEAGRPVGAYDLLDRLRAQREGAAPPTVYRALDFLMAEGLIHKVERLSAFVGCPLHDHAGDEGHVHEAQFLICGGCGTVRELEAAPVRAALEAAAGQLGFTIQGMTVEAEGVCAACAAGVG